MLINFVIYSMHDLIIIGNSAAGMFAAVYAAAQNLKVLMFANEVVAKNEDEDFAMIKNKFNKTLETHREFFTLKSNSPVISLDKNVVSFSVENAKGEIFYSRAVIVAEYFLDKEDITLKDSLGKIKVDQNMGSNVPGLFAAGSANNLKNKDTFIEAAEGAKAAMAVSKFLNKQK